MNKGSATSISVYVFDPVGGLPVTGDAANLTAYVNKDYAGVNVLADTSATEMSSTNAAGFYSFAVSGTETDANILLFTAKSSTATVSVMCCPPVVFTTPPSFAQGTLALNNTAVASFALMSQATTVASSFALMSQAATVASSFGLLSAAVDAVPTATENANGLLDLADAIETSVTLRSATRITMAGSANGLLSGFGAAGAITVTVSSMNDDPLVELELDGDGNRTASTLL